MNALTFERIAPNHSMPWFDDYAAHNRLCRVYNDGNCYIAVPKQEKAGAKKKRERIHTLVDDSFDSLYLEAFKANLTGEKLKEYVLNGLRKLFPKDWTLSEYVDKRILAISRNLSARKKRFRRKAFLNTWNYFVTFTYDDEKHDEDSFQKRLRKMLSNLHSRRGWLYMGVFERAPETGRLHFHAILYVPEGQMLGEIYERKDYSTKQHKIQITHPNKFFEDRLGRNDFECLSEAELRRGSTMQYLLKYLEKTDERIVYSRGIPTDLTMEINDNDVVCEMFDFVLKLVLFNDVVDYETDVKRTRSRSPYVQIVSLTS